jgi:hypothetical protein
MGLCMVPCSRAIPAARRVSPRTDFEVFKLKMTLKMPDWSSIRVSADTRSRACARVRALDVFAESA